MHTHHSESGYAALTMLVVSVGVGLTILGGLAFFVSREVDVNRIYTKSVESQYIAEGGIEDAVYRVLSGRTIGASETLVVGNGSTTITVTTAGNQTIIRSDGKRDTYGQNLETAVDITTTGINFFYGVQVGQGGLTMSNNSRINGNVYSDGNIIGGAGATITGDVIVAGGIASTTSDEWSTMNADQFFATTSANRDIAQSFTASAGGPLNRVSVYLGKVGNPTSNITLRVTADNAGKPATSDLANTSIPYTSVGTTASWIDVTFATPPTIATGTKYWIVLDYGGSSVANYWNWRKDTSDGYAGNTGRHAGDWNSGGTTWVNVSGDLAFRTWIGGVNTRIEDVIVGSATTSTARANSFVNTTVHGSACPNAYCIYDSPSQQPLPISAGVIQDWRDAAAAGGTCAPPTCDVSGNLTINSTTKTIGPLKIPGNLTLTNNATLTVTGTIWVVGDINLSNNCTVRLSPAYGSISGVLMTDDEIDVSNNCIFQGSGSAGSYIMLLSDKDAPTSTAIDVANNSDGVIYYASRGRINFSNNAAAKEATGYGIDLSNNATITYESGLANTEFSSGPSGGYDIVRWRKVE